MLRMASITDEKTKRIDPHEDRSKAAEPELAPNPARESDAPGKQDTAKLSYEKLLFSVARRDAAFTDPVAVQCINPLDQFKDCARSRCLARKIFVIFHYPPAGTSAHR